MGHCQPQCRHTMHALLHSIQATVSFFLVLYTILASITLPTSFSPLVESTTHFHQIHAYQPIPFSSVCKCLDTIPLVFFIKPSTVSTNHLTLKQFSLVTRLLLILSGNVSVNPGPAHQLNFSSPTLTPDPALLSLTILTSQLFCKNLSLITI